MSSIFNDRPRIFRNVSWAITCCYSGFENVICNNISILLKTFLSCVISCSIFIQFILFSLLVRFPPTQFYCSIFRAWQKPNREKKTFYPYLSCNIVPIAITIRIFSFVVGASVFRYFGWFISFSTLCSIRFCMHLVFIICAFVRLRMVMNVHSHSSFKIE